MACRRAAAAPAAPRLTPTAADLPYGRCRVLHSPPAEEQEGEAAAALLLFSTGFRRGLDMSIPSIR